MDFTPICCVTETDSVCEDILNRLSNILKLFKQELFAIAVQKVTIFTDSKVETLPFSRRKITNYGFF